MDLSGWDVDLRALYGFFGWRRRSRFHLSESLYESPDGSRAVLLYHIGEVGVNKQVAALALLADKAAPRVLWTSGRARFWYEGAPEEPVSFTPDGRGARVYEFLEGRDGRMDWRERLLELETGTLRPASGA